MKRLIISILVVIFIVSCREEEPSKELIPSIKSSQYEQIDIVSYRGFIKSFVVYDKKTKVMYNMSTDGKLTLLINQDGTPRIFTDQDSF